MKILLLTILLIASQAYACVDVGKVDLLVHTPTEQFSLGNVDRVSGKILVNKGFYIKSVFISYKSSPKVLSNYIICSNYSDKHRVMDACSESSDYGQDIVYNLPSKYLRELTSLSIEIESLDNKHYLKKFILKDNNAKFGSNQPKPRSNSGCGPEVIVN